MMEQLFLRKLRKWCMLCVIQVASFSLVNFTLSLYPLSPSLTYQINSYLLTQLVLLIEDATEKVSQFTTLLKLIYNNYYFDD